MNREESIAHFQKIEAVRKAALDEGKSQEEAHETAKSAWNEWAEGLLAERKILEENGDWKSEESPYTYGREVGSNEKTKAWFELAHLNFNTLRFALKEELNKSEAQGVEINSGDKPSDVKSIYSEGATFNFSGYIFPANAGFNKATFSGTADFNSATFNDTAYFNSATFSANAEFSSATFSERAGFNKATFSANADFSSATFSERADFSSATFSDNADFYSATFIDNADFYSATFIDNADFSSATFSGNADFRSATFNDTVEFSSATFSCTADFRSATFDFSEFNSATFNDTVEFISATFSDNADFRSTTFSGIAGFNSATFSGIADFRSATFSDNANFRSATFSGTADFRSSTFGGTADFRSATFSGIAGFISATFSGTADFRSATFRVNADFRSATFSANADFRSAIFSWGAEFISATFSSNADFNSATFSDLANFFHAEFKSYTDFSEAKFNSQASFHAIDSQVSFNLSHARFRHVPDFLNAKFREEEPPNLDNIIVDEFTFWNTKKDTATKYRKLKKMAIQAHYIKGELEFHAQELRAERFVWYNGWPISEKLFSKYIKTKKVLLPKVWRVSFWFTLMYELFSDFGRSVFRPIISWALLLFICANIYLCYHPPAKENISNAQDLGSLEVAFTAWDNWFEQMPCLKPNLQDSTSLANSLLTDTTPQLEAFSLSLKNGFVFIDWDRSEAAMQTFGCLYGLTETKTTLVPSVPPMVSFVNILQNVLSVLLIFLFGLAVRNMLKLK